MDGRLTVASELGRGTIFSLHLPAKPAGEGAPDATNPVTRVVDRSPVRNRREVLLAEDHDVNQMLVTAMLGRLGISADIAQDGAEAVAMVQRAFDAGEPYRLVLMDMQMPGMDGLEATEIIRARFAPDRLPIVALTANAYADDVEACLAAGMQAHIAKPIKLDELKAAVRRFAQDRPSDVVQAVPEIASGDISPALLKHYQTRKTETLRRLEQFSRDGIFADAEILEVTTMLHHLAGTAGMFGDAALGGGASALQDGLGVWSVDERPNRLRQAVQALLHSA
jgi:CheY-like chemotaxis protein